MTKSLKESNFVALARCVYKLLLLRMFHIGLAKFMNMNLLEKAFKIVIGENSQVCSTNVRNIKLLELS